MSAPYRIGPGVYKETHPRLEIRELYNNHEQFTLFILAWDLIRTPDYQPAPARFEEIGGIHGMPYRPWPGDPYDKSTEEGGEWLGYCNHGSILFPNWHRPYIMLLEQSINQAAQGLAGDFAHKFPDEAEKWLQAARKLRFPFWDWTLPITGEEGLPEILYTPTLILHGPGGETFEHENILASYKFNKIIDGFDNRPELSEIVPVEKWVVSYYKQWKRTYRWPNSTPSDTKEDIDGMNKELKSKENEGMGIWRSLTNTVSTFFNFPLTIEPNQYANAWDEFSNSTFQSSRPDTGGTPHSPYIWKSASLEQPHDLVHLVVGGSGHMSDNDTAGFDPIFYLHHCNVDRLWAFWAQVYPDYVAGTQGYLDVDGVERRPFVQSGGTFGQSNDQVVDDTSGLLPFRKTNNQYWNSQDTYFTTAQGNSTKYYTYPDIDGISLDTGKKLSIDVREKQRASLQKYFGFDPVQSRANAPQIKQPLFSHIAHDVLPGGQEPVHNYRHFVITTSLSATAFNGSYIVRVSLSSGNNRVAVGAVAVLGRGSSSKCGNCQRRQAAGSRVRGVIVIPHEVMADFIEQNNLNTENTDNKALIRAFKDSLHASVVLPSGRIQAEASRNNAESNNLPSLSPEDAPLLQLHSANISALQANTAGHNSEGPQPDSPPTPYEFYDWRDHDSVGMTYLVKTSQRN